MRTTFLVALSFLLLAPVEAQAKAKPSAPAGSDASKRPSGFRDIVWGTSEAEVKKALNLDGDYDCMDLQGERHCSTYFEIGDVHVTAFLKFYNDRFGQILMWFPSDHFDFVKEVFIDKYGKPTSSRVTEVRTRMNVPYVNFISTWRWADVDIYFEKYGPDIEQGFASVTTREYSAGVVKREKEKKKGAKDSF